ncbi:MAG TPA: LamG-like jellyroll fold domain-containing protein, partial [Gemmataceae bacterium]|nr:LamG-like jellyroll fold domain-containing protein [Gemmataceae bacterium]
AADASGKGNAGTLSNTAWTAAGKYGSALSFNGTSSWVTVASASSLNLTGAMTLEAWVKPTALSGWQAVLLKETSGGLAYALYANDGVPRPAGYVHIGGDNEASGTAGLPLNTWSYLAVTYDGANLNMYVNATLVGSLAQTGNIATSTGTLRIGGDSIWGEYFNGLIDEVRVYSRALQPVEIQNDMNTRVNSDTQAPTVPTNLTATGAINTATLSWTASSDNVGVDHYDVYRSTTSGFTPSAANKVGQSTTPGYTDTGLAPGTYYYRVDAADTAGNVSAASAEASAAAVSDTTPPTVTVTNPASGATVSGIITVSANASDNVGVVGVQFLLNGANLGAEDTTAPYSVSWNTTSVANGTYTLAAVARDAAGNTATSAVSVTVNNVADTTPPTVSLTSPASGATVSGSVTVSASATDNVGVVGVQFKLDGNNLGAEVTTVPYSVSWNTTTATNGSHTLTAVARDAAGNTATAATVTVTVSNATGLVGAWGFEEGSGTTTADASGHGLSGTLSNATWTTAGKFGKALSFNGSNAWVTVSDNTLLHLTSGMTVEAWVKPAATSTDWTAAVLKERGTVGLAYALYATDGANKPPAGYINKSGTDYNATGTSILALNTWTHLAVTYEGATIRLYVNGTQAASKAVSGTINSSTSPLRFGGDSVWGEYFNGLIDEVRVYSVALTAAQIQTDMNTPVSSPQLAAEGAVPGGSAPVLTAAELAPVAAEAVRRWEGSGLTPAQAAALGRVQFRITDLGSTGELGLTPLGGSVVTIDDDGAGRGWFVDPTPSDDAEFRATAAPAELNAASRPAARGYDLLTVVMHELGHVIGLADLNPADVPHDLLTTTLGLGTRWLPAVPAARPGLSAGTADGDPVPVGAVAPAPAPTTPPPSLPGPASGFGFVPAAWVVAPPTAAAPVPVPSAGPAVPAAPAVSPTRQEPASGLPSARPSVTLADPAREDAPTPVDPG